MSVIPIGVPTRIRPQRAAEPVPAGDTPEGLLKLLEGKLREQQDEVQVYEDYFAGNHPLKFATDKFKQVFGNLFGAFSDNWCELIVLASAERLEITGFRFGADSRADLDVRKLWQRNNLDNGSALAHTESIKTGKSYIGVNTDGSGRITVEHPAQVYVLHEAGDRTKRLAAIKKWRGRDGYAYATVVTRTNVYKWKSKAPQASVEGGTDAPETGWELRKDDPGGLHKLGVVNFIPLYNNPGMLCDGTSDLKVAIPLTNAINKQILDMMIASEYVAYPQRVLTGVELPKDPNTNLPLASAELKAAVSRLWNFENPNAKVEQLAAGDLNNYVKPIEMLIQHLAAQTRTPPHYLLSSIINASGDALKAAEAGLVSKVEKKILDFSDPWEEAMRLAFKATGDMEKAEATDLETIWADPEKKTEAEKVDAATKLLSLDVPHEIAWERAGLSPKEIEKAKQALPATLAAKAAAARSTQDPNAPSDPGVDPQ